MNTETVYYFIPANEKELFLGGEHFKDNEIGYISIVKFNNLSKNLELQLLHDEHPRVDEKVTIKKLKQFISDAGIGFLTKVVVRNGAGIAEIKEIKENGEVII